MTPALLLLALLPQGTACTCGPEALPWRLFEPSLGSELSPTYLESIRPPAGEWCLQGRRTVWACSGVEHRGVCLGTVVAVNYETIPPSQRWLLVTGSREARDLRLCFPCLEPCRSGIFSDGFESGDLRRWSRVHG